MGFHINAVTTETVFFLLLSVRPRKGSKLGANTTDNFYADIQYYFSSDATTKRTRISGAMMPESLIGKYPKRYNNPLEQHINAVIHKMFTK